MSGNRSAPVMTPGQLAGIVLAAGGAARFGGPKQVALVGGVSLVARAAQLALPVCPAGVVVVTGAYADVVGEALAGLTVRISFNPEWRSGVAGSLRCGIAALPTDSCACLVTLCDQAAVDERDLARLAAAWAAAPHRVAAARYEGILGVPTIFPAAYWPKLQALAGDQGARMLLASLPDVTVVEMPHAARDVDTPADLPPTLPGVERPVYRGLPGQSENPMNRIRVEYFAIFREHTGRGSEEMQTAARTAAELYRELDARYRFPGLASIKVAINDEFRDWNAPLANGDSVVFIPPVAGG